MGLHTFQGILRSPQKARLCNPCLQNELSPLSQEGHHCWHDCFVPFVGELLPRRARRGSAVEAGTVLLLPSIRIERLMAVGGIGWGQAVSGLYARGRRDWQPPQTGPATSIACIAVRVTRPPPRFCRPISRCDWSMASHAALRVRDPWPSNKPNAQAKPTVA